MTTRLAVIVSHPIQHFAPWHREVARHGDLDLRVFFCCDWGLEAYADAEFGAVVKWDVPLVDGYAHEFLPIARRPTALGFRTVDNPGVGAALDRFDPHVVKVFGWAYRTNWRAALWARTRGRPVMVYSDSNIAARRALWKTVAREGVVRGFYRLVDGAFYVGDNNRAHHARYGLPDARLFPGMLPIDRERLLAAVPDPVAARRRLRAELGIDPGAFVVVFAGKYSERKRPMDLARAAVAAEKRGVPVVALLVGEGSERARLEAYVRAEGARNVVLTGFVNQSKVPEYYAAADALAVMSEHDPHPLVVSEGGSFGLPVIVSDRVGCIGPHDTARPGENAVVFPLGDVARFADAIVSLARDAPLRERLGRSSRAISAGQDVSVAARALADAATTLHRLGPRSWLPGRGARS